MGSVHMQISIQTTGVDIVVPISVYGTKKVCGGPGDLLGFSVLTIRTKHVRSYSVYVLAG